MKIKAENSIRKVFVILLSVSMMFSVVSFNSPRAYAAGNVTFENVDILMIYNHLRYVETRIIYTLTDFEIIPGKSEFASTGDMSGTIVPAKEGELAIS